MDERTLQASVFVFLLLCSLFVLVTCVWKIVRLVALFKIESRLAELEQTAKGEPATALNAIPQQEVRALQRLSLLAGFKQQKVMCN
jgi:hypothetical protein